MMRTAGAWIALAVAVLAYPSGPAHAAGPPLTIPTPKDGVPLCVAEGGNPQGPPVVLIHGFAQSYAVFQRQFDSPLAAHYRLLALDMRGHGCSGKPWDRAAYDQARPWADDIHTLLEAKKLTRPLLVGWSAGGFWIMDYVREYGTAAVAGLVLAGSHGGLLAATPVAAQAGDIKAMRAAAEAYPAGVPEGIELSDRFVSRLSARPLPADLSRIMGAAALWLPACAGGASAGRVW
ncbi:MAG: alpha/beta hydrolase [Gammaproteobacteria bacterium]|nr:alpha/beta hydrolase [Gammaproteobacteria bacterium]